MDVTRHKDVRTVTGGGIERRLDHIAYGGVVGLCVIAILIWLL